MERSDGGDLGAPDRVSLARRSLSWLIVGTCLAGAAACVWRLVVAGSDPGANSYGKLLVLGAVLPMSVAWSTAQETYLQSVAAGRFVAVGEHLVVTPLRPAGAWASATPRSTGSSSSISIGAAR